MTETTTRPDVSASDKGPGPSRQQRADPSKLHGFARFVAGLVGFTVLYAGVTGVFTIGRDWGPIALLVVGAIFLLVALAGRLPRLKWEGKEVEWPAAEVGDVIADHAEDLPAAERDALLDDLSRISPEAAGPVMRAVLNEAQILHHVWKTLPPGVELLTEEDALRLYPQTGGQFGDGLLQDASGKRVILEARGSGRLPASLLTNVERIRQNDTNMVGGLLITTRRLPEVLREQYAERGWQVHVVDPSNVDVVALKSAIWSAFNSPRTA
ncbi:hypothetical protein [Arthrobacter sp. CJ23]|uniref:hypothetical protein n=1 Tax=Arthrobacter sp. CJ23 TaxID=2972479 RepID=UPI00215BFB31|nr:hypothetical protein [Arthrobacter sp. CJ23]UVJ39013.1 hypothetical protein NVV90_17650 [Arthrobacter sp. CJ23]